MQMEFDLTNVEIVTLKSKIGELDPVAQAEAVVKYLGKSCTQEQLSAGVAVSNFPGERLGKTRDWIAKRVQFIRALDKLPKSEQKEAKELVRHRTISMDVVILVADLPRKQRKEILSAHPMVAEARRLINVSKMSQSPKAKLRVLEDGLSPAYIALETIFGNVITLGVGTVHAFGSEIISASLYKRAEKFIDVMWYKNRRFGFGVLISQERIMDEETLNERINWLEFKENKRIEILQKAIADCQSLCFNMINELETKAQQVDGLTKAVESLQMQLVLERMKRAVSTSDFSLNFGNGIPALKLDVSGSQLDIFYRTLAKAFHPDKHPDNQEWYQTVMTAITVWHGQVKGKI